MDFLQTKADGQETEKDLPQTKEVWEMEVPEQII